MIARTIVTIRKHIVPKEALTGRSERIRIDESADGGIIVTALQVVEPGFSVVNVAASFVKSIISHLKSLRKRKNKSNSTKF